MSHSLSDKQTSIKTIFDKSVIYALNSAYAHIQGREMSYGHSTVAGTQIPTSLLVERVVGQ
jgi:hypothetical protein